MTEKDLAREDTMGEGTDSRTALEEPAGSAHSPLPWRFNRCPENGVMYLKSADAPDGDHFSLVGEVAVLYGNSNSNAAFIVKAVNHHEELVGLLRDVLDTDSWHLAGDLSDRIEAALAKVR